MFNKNLKNFLNKFKSETDETIKESEHSNSDLLVLELSNTYISYTLNNDKKIHTLNLAIQEFESFDTTLKLWLEAINVIVETLNVKPMLSIIIKSENFSIRNSEKFLDDKIKNKYFANKLAIEETNIDVKHLSDKSYLVVEFKFLQKILFAFKEYKIKDIYDISILNSEFIKKQQNHLYIDISFDSCDIVLNQKTIQKRTLNNNLTSLIQECAKDTYLDYETSYQNIKLDFKSISTYDELEKSNKAMQKSLKKFIDNILNDIEKTTEYFSLHENMEYIENIYINGDILEFDFIIKILSDKLNVNLIVLNKFIRLNSLSKINLSIFEQTEAALLKKLNLNFEGLNYNDGREEYIFIENRFVQKGLLTASEKTKIVKEKNEVKFDNNRSFLYDENDVAIWKMSMSELFSFIKESILNKSNGNNQGEVKEINTNIFYLLAIIPVVFTLVYILNTVSDLNTNFESNVDTLNDRITRVDSLKKRMLAKNKELNINILNKDVDKIFWTQKLITIANAMPNEIWLSSVTMENMTQTIENKEVTKQVMILEARSLPSHIGHIASIALYMDKLLNANDDFKKDFSSITFGGAEILNEYGYEIVNFKLLCNFEKNINVTDIKKNKNKNASEDKSIGENLMNINKSSDMQKDLLEKL